MVRYSASKWDTETKMIYLMGRSPLKYHNNFKDTEEWQTFLASKNASVTAPIDQLSAIASEELVSRIVDAEMIERMADGIVVIVEANPDRAFSSVRIASPFPIDPEATNNRFAPALAAAVTTGLEAILKRLLEARGTGDLKVIRDLYPNESDRDKGILNIVDNQRGNTSNPNPGEEVDLYMQRLIDSPCTLAKLVLVLFTFPLMTSWLVNLQW